jgi:hypothetical protein
LILVINIVANDFLASLSAAGLLAALALTVAALVSLGAIPPNLVANGCTQNSTNSGADFFVATAMAYCMAQGAADYTADNGPGR